MASPVTPADHVQAAIDHQLVHAAELDAATAAAHVRAISNADQLVRDAINERPDLPWRTN